MPSRLASTRIERASRPSRVGELDGRVDHLVEREPLPRTAPGRRLLDGHDVPPEQAEHGVRFGGHEPILTSSYAVRNKC